MRRRLIASTKITYVIERLQGLAMEINALCNAGCAVLRSSAESLKIFFFPLDDDNCIRTFIELKSQFLRLVPLF